ncbi:MAG: hypothetical protein HW387_1502 [Parachlamydiales bacterium]|nr:hypothetical protein [Parachlamydiales bacterium]
MKRSIFLFLITLVCSDLSAASAARIRILNEPLTVDLAQTPSERSLGLMGRKSLPEGTGMLFVYEKPGILSFWMKNTRIPLSIAFFDAGRRLINTVDMDPPQGTHLPIYQSAKPAQYALEVPQGWFESHGIRPSMRFEWETGFSKSCK